MVNSLSKGFPRLVLWVALAAPPASGLAANAIAINGGDQNKELGVGDLQGGAGSDFNPNLVFGSTFTLQVTSDAACRVSVQRTGTGWLAAGDLIVEIKAGNTFGSPLRVDDSDRAILTSPTPLIAELYELRYRLRYVTVQNAPGTYTAHLTYTVTDA